jgi:hypothetical protein
LLHLALLNSGLFCQPAGQPANQPGSQKPACRRDPHGSRRREQCGPRCTPPSTAQPSHAKRSQAKSMPPTLLPSSSRGEVRGPSEPRANRERKADSTLRSSRAASHPNTNRALCRLTSEVKRDPVHLTRYGRQRWQGGWGCSRVGLGLVTLIPKTDALVHWATGLASPTALATFPSCAAACLAARSPWLRPRWALGPAGVASKSLLRHERDRPAAGRAGRSFSESHKRNREPGQAKPSQSSQASQPIGGASASINRRASASIASEHQRASASIRGAPASIKGSIREHRRFRALSPRGRGC